MTVTTERNTYNFFLMGKNTRRSDFGMVHTFKYHTGHKTTENEQDRMDYKVRLGV